MKINCCHLTTFFLLFISSLIQAQSPKDFHGAKPILEHYKALYFLDDSDTRKIRMTLKNIQNAIDDPRLKGKLEVELVSFSDGYSVYKKSGPYETLLLGLEKKGLILAQCENTLRERKIDPSTLFSFIHLVPSGNGEIIIRGNEGWTIIA